MDAIASTTFTKIWQNKENRVSELIRKVIEIRKKDEMAGS